MSIVLVRNGRTVTEHKDAEVPGSQWARSSFPPSEHLHATGPLPLSGPVVLGIGLGLDSGAVLVTTSGTHLLTQRQIRCIQTLPEGHSVITVRDRTAIVRQPDGRLARIRPSGRLVVTIPVQKVRSYLHVYG